MGVGARFATFVSRSPTDAQGSYARFEWAASMAQWNALWSMALVALIINGGFVAVNAALLATDEETFYLLHSVPLGAGENPSLRQISARLSAAGYRTTPIEVRGDGEEHFEAVRPWDPQYLTRFVGFDGVERGFIHMGLLCNTAIIRLQCMGDEEGDMRLRLAVFLRDAGLPTDTTGAQFGDEFTMLGPWPIRILQGVVLLMSILAVVFAWEKAERLAKAAAYAGARR